MQWTSILLTSRLSSWWSHDAATLSSANELMSLSGDSERTFWLRWAQASGFILIVTNENNYKTVQAWSDVGVPVYGPCHIINFDVFCNICILYLSIYNNELTLLRILSVAERLDNPRIIGSKIGPASHHDLTSLSSFQPCLHLPNLRPWVSEKSWFKPAIHDDQ